MSRLLILAAVAVFTLTEPTRAMDGVFDRSAEVDKYIQVIGTGTRNTLTEAAREIHDADIGDARLARALRDKLQSDLPTLDPKNSVDAKYRKSMVMAIASTGAMEFASDVKGMCAGIQAKRSVTYCDQAADRMQWYKAKNELMASRQYHRDGDDPKVSMIMNLLMSDDLSFKVEGADKMNWGKILDVRLMEAIEPQLLQYVNAGPRNATRMQANVAAHFVKLLGYSGDPKYRDTLSKVLAARPGESVKRRAAEGLRRLDLSAAGEQ
jgi:hypothetical protein